MEGFKNKIDDYNERVNAEAGNIDWEDLETLDDDSRQLYEDIKAHDLFKDMCVYIALNRELDKSQYTPNKEVEEIKKEHRENEDKIKKEAETKQKELEGQINTKDEDLRKTQEELNEVKTSDGKIISELKDKLEESNDKLKEEKTSKEIYQEVVKKRTQKQKELINSIEKNEFFTNLRNVTNKIGT